MTTDTERANLIERLRNQAEGWNDEGAAELTVLMGDAVAYIEQHPPVDAAVERDAEFYDVCRNLLRCSVDPGLSPYIKENGIRRGDKRGSPWAEFVDVVRERDAALTAQQQESGS